ncbi:type VI secretion lipoprotein TssJ [Psychrobacter alimentarius]|uniref:type VI secretion lipoprotein TssJ n=1 Tax=Psychrobacter alimentarius TaxID=261164 RepID=UPI001918D429|nr:type VI secretion lipoprotein TssJ [Psychrobacter alimentarius]
MTDSSAGRVDSDLENLRAHVERQQQQLEMMRDEQQALQERLKRQQFALTIKPTANANAGRTKQGTASTAYVAFLEEESQFTETETLAAKEISIIPNRDVSLTLTMPPDTRFIAVKVGLRHTKKRSQFLIPIASLTMDVPLTLGVGACDVTIIEGIDTKLVPAFTTKLKYYQQPLVSCL